jgi:WD40 repeat protein
MRIKAHRAKIYGIDWSRSWRNEIITCSLDKSIKVWDIEASQLRQGLPEPKTAICTNYPVWRARDMPFGHGVLSIPQRGETALDMWSYSNEAYSVHSFEGHTDVVKEFVWRLGGTGMYQLQHELDKF